MKKQTEEEIKRLNIELMKTYGVKGNPNLRKKIRKEIARLRTKENEK